MQELHRERLEVIDLAKGFAILSVICIHAEVFSGVFFLHVINRAVPLFLILFGITSELGWRRLAARSEGRAPALRWYASRFRRLLPPMWAAMAAFWVVAISAGGSSTTPPAGSVVASFIGFAPGYGTSWFVALVIQIVLVFPFLRWLSTRVGVVVSCVLAALSSGLSIWFVYDIANFGEKTFGAQGPMGPFYYQWIFAPRVFWQVMAGVALAHIGLSPSRRMTAVCAALVAAGPLICYLVAYGAPRHAVAVREMMVMALLDVPLAVAVLGLLTHVRIPKNVRGFLAWCGLSSWGLYLGHTLTHEVCHLIGLWPEKETVLSRALYATALLAAGAILVTLRSAAGAEAKAVDARG